MKDVAWPFLFLGEPSIPNSDAPPVVAIERHTALFTREMSAVTCWPSWLIVPVASPSRPWAAGLAVTVKFAADTNVAYG